MVLTVGVTVVPLLVMQRVSFPAWLWLGGQWASGTSALLVIAVALLMLARRARSRLLAAVALACTAAFLAVAGDDSAWDEIMTWLGNALQRKIRASGWTWGQVLEAT
ncbi:MAG TPA: hypothetical protein VMV17_04890, partial [Streptosporangiaceae bacterium]|nr:hypothetical protein [Streptosporangiaceae bacterium]